MSFLEASLARVFSWLLSNLRLQICESTCSDLAIDIIKDIVNEPKVPAPSIIDLQPTQVIKTTIYQAVSRYETEQPSIPLSSGSNLFSLIALLMVLIIGFLLLGVCVFAAVRRCNAKARPLIARAEAERDTIARHLKIVVSHHNVYKTNLLETISRLTQENDGFRAMCEQLVFTQQWLATLKADAERNIQLRFAQVCNRICELEAQNSLLEARHAYQEKQHLAVIEALKKKNLRVEQTPASISNELSTQNAELKSKVQQLTDQILQLQAGHKLENDALLREARALEDDRSSLESDKKTLSEMHAAEVKTNATHAKTAADLQEKIARLKFNESKLKKEKETASERQVVAELETRNHLDAIMNLEKKQTTLVSENGKLAGELRSKTQADSKLVADVAVLTTKCSDLENEKADLVTRIDKLTEESSRYRLSNTHLFNQARNLLQEVEAMKAKAGSAEKQRSFAQDLCKTAQNDLAKTKNTLTRNEAKFKNDLKDARKANDKISSELRDKCAQEDIMKADLSNIKVNVESLEKEKVQLQSRIKESLAKEKQLSRLVTKAQEEARKSKTTLATMEANHKAELEVLEQKNADLVSSLEQHEKPHEDSGALEDAIKANETLKLLVYGEARNMQSFDHSLRQMSGSLSELFDRTVVDAVTNIATDIIQQDDNEELRTAITERINDQFERARENFDARQARIQTVTKAMQNSTIRLLTIARDSPDEVDPEQQEVKDIADIENEVDSWKSIPGQENRTRRRRVKKRAAKDMAQSSQDDQVNE